MGAQIQLGSALGTVRCKVRDLSDGGCRLMLDRPMVLPRVFQMRLDRDGTVFQCTIVWRNGAMLGVAFAVGPHKADRLEPWTGS